MAVITQVADRAFRVESTLGRRRIAQWLVLGSERIALIDTGVAGMVEGQIVGALRELGHDIGDVAEVLVSHADVDHYGGNAEIRRLAPRATIRSHPSDRPLIESWATIFAQRYGWYRQFGLDYDAATHAWLHDASGPDVPLDGTIAAGDRVELGGVALEIIDLPGHSAGHLGFWLERDRVLISVDAVLERGLYDIDGTLISPPPYVTASGYRTTLDRVAGLAPSRLETAHYPEIRDDAVAAFVDASRRFADRLEEVIAGRLGDDARSIAELTAVADRELGPFSEMSNELARSVAAHLEDLECRGLARSVGDQPRWLAA
ncbi:MAG: MBL fold metallo-hydrolase [Solirubrobacteraceae bacterium]|nr:MBL fold metallo-hydrolase [Solirubrobacteraceae bacterium]